MCEICELQHTYVHPLTQESNNIMQKSKTDLISRHSHSQRKTVNDLFCKAAASCWFSLKHVGADVSLRGPGGTKLPCVTVSNTEYLLRSAHRASLEEALVEGLSRICCVTKYMK